MENLPISFSQTASGRAVGVLSLPDGITIKIKAFVEPGRVAYHLSLYEGARKRFQKLMDPGPGFWPGKDLFWGDTSHNREKQAISYLWERAFGYMDIPGIKEFFTIENE